MIIMFIIIVIIISILLVVYVFGGLLLLGVWDPFVDSPYGCFMFSAMKFAINKFSDILSCRSVINFQTC